MFNVDDLNNFSKPKSKSKNQNIFKEPKKEYPNINENSDINLVKMNSSPNKKNLTSSHTTANLKTYNVDLSNLNIDTKSGENFN